MNTFGHIIKFERIRQNIKQVKLADGICTPSYLSKIESNLIVPSEEILELLFERLSIIAVKQEISEVEYFQYVKNVYFEAIAKKNTPEISLKLNDILKTSYLFENSSYFYTYQLLIIRLKLFVHNIKHDSTDYITTISKFVLEFDNYQLFLFHNSVGYYHLAKNDLVSSTVSFEKGTALISTIDLDEREIADISYILSSVLLLNKRLIAALEYNSKALYYFNKELLYFRSIESYIIRALIYKNAMNPEKAYEYLKLAETISKKHNSYENLSLIYINLANTFVVKKNVKKSIEYYKKSMQIAHDSRVVLTCIYSIVLENSKLNETNEVLYWSKKGLALYKNDPADNLTHLYHHLTCFISLNEKSISFEEDVKNAIDYFLHMKDYRHTHRYYLLLSNYFHSEKKYKTSVMYYKLADKYLAIKEKWQFIEDL